MTIIIKKNTSMSVQILFCIKYIWQLCFILNPDGRNCKSELFSHKETSDFAATSALKTKFSELNIYLPWFFSCQIKKTSLSEVVIQDLKMHMSYTKKK